MTLEDTLLAGALLEKLGCTEAALKDDSSALALAAWRQNDRQSLAERLQRTQGGRNLLRIDRGQDIQEAALQDTIDCAPEFDAARGCIVGPRERPAAR